MMAVGLILAFLGLAVGIPMANYYSGREPSDWIVAAFIAFVIGLGLIVASLAVVAWRAFP